MITAKRYTVRFHDAASVHPLAEHVLLDDALSTHAAVNGRATIFDDATGLPAEGLEEMAASSPAAANVDVWIAEQRAAAIAHREQCVATLAALRAEIATVEATIARLDVLIHGRDVVPAPKQRLERKTIQGYVLAHLAAYPRCAVKEIALAVYGTDDINAVRSARLVIVRLKKAGKIRNVWRGQWEVV